MPRFPRLALFPATSWISPYGRCFGVDLCRTPLKPWLYFLYVAFQLPGSCHQAPCLSPSPWDTHVRCDRTSIHAAACHFCAAMARTFPRGFSRIGFPRFPPEAFGVPVSHTQASCTSPAFALPGPPACHSAHRPDGYSSLTPVEDPCGLGSHQPGFSRLKASVHLRHISAGSSLAVFERRFAVAFVFLVQGPSQIWESAPGFTLGTTRYSVRSEVSPLSQRQTSARFAVSAPLSLPGGCRQDGQVCTPGQLSSAQDSHAWPSADLHSLILGWLLWGADLLPTWFEMFGRSFLLFQLLAFLRLWIRAVPLQKGSSAGNRCVRSARVCLRGAPLCIALAFCAMPASAVPLASTSHSRAALPQPSHDTAPDAFPTHASEPGHAHSALNLGPRPLGLPIVEADAALAFAANEARRQVSWHIPVQVLLLQRSSRFMPVASDGYTDYDDFVEIVEDELDAFPNGLRYRPVLPQPRVDHAVLLAEYPYLLSLQLISVCIELVRPGLPSRYWADTLESPVSFDDLVTHLGRDWIPGSRILIGVNGHRLQEQETFHLGVGDLIQVLSPTSQVSPSRTLGSKLARPDMHFQSLEARGYPVEFTADHRYALLEPLIAPKTIQFSPSPGRLDPTEVLQSHAEADWGLTAIHWPRRPIRHLNIRGIENTDVAAAFPRRVNVRAPVFVDPRQLGLHLQVFASMTGFMSLGAFLDNIGLALPAQDLLHVTGTAPFDATRRWIHIHEGDLVILAYADPCGAYCASHGIARPSPPSVPTATATAPTASASLQPRVSSDVPSNANRERSPRRSAASSHVPCNDASTALFGQDHEDVERQVMQNQAFSLDVPAHFPGIPAAATTASTAPAFSQSHVSCHASGTVNRERSPRRSAAAQHVPCADRPAALHGQDHEDVEHQDMRNRVLSLDVPPTHLPGDASVTDALVSTLAGHNPMPPIRPAPCSPLVPASVHPEQSTLEEQFAWHEQICHRVVEQSDDAPPLDRAPVSIATLQGPEMFVAEEVCLPVRLLSFQGPTLHCALWYSRGEDVRAFLTRADILLNHDPTILTVIAPMFQPRATYVTLLLVPSWWAQRSVCPLVCTTHLDASEPFIQVGHHGEAIEDIMPASLLPGVEEVDVYILPDPSTDTFADPLAIQPARDLSSGTILRFQPSDAMEGTLPSLPALLQSLPHLPAPRPAHAHAWEPQPLDVVILGVSFDQFVITLAVGDVLPQVAAFFDMRPEDVLLQPQVGQFDRLCVCGKAIQRAYGFRSRVTSDRHLVGRGLFIDGRLLGRPVAYRRFVQVYLEAEDLCRSLSVEVPDGYHIVYHGGAPLPASPTYFTFEPGETFVVWFEPNTCPASSASLSSSTAASGRGSGNDDVNPDDSNGHRSRSRSPAIRPASPARRTDAADAAPATALCASDSTNQLYGARGDAACLGTVRHLPTPCRARHWAVPSVCHAAGPLDWAILDDVPWGRCTLLDTAECRLSRDDLVQFLEPRPPTRFCIRLEECCSMTDFQRLSLDLVDILPARCPPVEFGADWLDADMAPVLGSPYLPRDLAFRFAQVQTVWQASPSEEPLALHIYTDGSAGGDASDGFLAGCAWAFSVWAVYPDKELLLGHSAHASVPPGTRYYCGEQDHTPLTAERLALLWAFAWVIEVGASYHLPLVMCYDCTTAGHAAFACARSHVQSGSAACCSLAEALSIARQCANNRALITPRHVRSHVGILQNEWSDQLAKHARRSLEHVESRTLPDWMPQLLRHPLSRWSWMAGHTFTDLPTLFSFESEFDRMLREDRPAPAPPLPVSPAPPNTARAQLRLVFVSYNALTLRDPKATGKQHPQATNSVGVRVSGRRELLKSQFLKLGAQFVGIQETRTPDQAILPDADYWMLHAPCDGKGLYGVALWLSKDIPYGFSGETKHRLERHHFAVVTQSPRLLIVRIIASFVDLLVVVAHAPHAAAKDEHAHVFWHTVEGFLHDIPPSAHIVLLTDANAHLGSETTESVGDVFAEQENPPVRALHNLLQTWELFAPSTFSNNHVGPSPTWFSPGNVPHRLDYIILPMCWRRGAVSRVLDTFEALQGRLDHMPVLVECTLQHVHHDQPFREAPARRATRPRVGSKENEALIFQHLQSTMPSVPWDVNVDDHYARWSHDLTQAWHDSVSAPASVPRKTYLTYRPLLRSLSTARHCVNTCEMRADLLPGSALRSLSLPCTWARERLLSVPGPLTKLRSSEKHCNVASLAPGPSCKQPRTQCDGPSTPTASTTCSPLEKQLLSVTFVTLVTSTARSGAPSPAQGPPSAPGPRHFLCLFEMTGPPSLLLLSRQNAGDCTSALRKQARQLLQRSTLLCFQHKSHMLGPGQSPFPSPLSHIWPRLRMSCLASPPGKLPGLTVSLPSFCNCRLPKRQGSSCPCLLSHR